MSPWECFPESNIFVTTFNTKKNKDVDLIKSEEPNYDLKSIYGVVPSSLSILYDVREVIARIVDGSKCLEFKKLYFLNLMNILQKN